MTIGTVLEITDRNSVKDMQEVSSHSNRDFSFLSEQLLIKQFTLDSGNCEKMSNCQSQNW